MEDVATLGRLRMANRNGAVHHNRRTSHSVQFPSLTWSSSRIPDGDLFATPIEKTYRHRHLALAFKPSLQATDRPQLEVRAGEQPAIHCHENGVELRMLGV